MKVQYHINPRSAIIYYGDESRTFMSDDPNYEQIVQFVTDNNEQGLVDLIMSLKTKIESAYGDQGFEVKNDIVYVNGEGLPTVLSDRLLMFANNNLPCKPLLNFWKRLKRNPSYRAINCLFDCLDHNNHPILPDGRFVAWKSVRSDFKDCYTGTFDNSVGNKLKTDRNQVDEDMNKTCSYGFHVASWDYAHNIYNGSITIAVAVCPSAVVAIPKDYSLQKLRVNEYEVLEVVTKENHEPLALAYCEHNDGCDCDDLRKDTCPGCNFVYSQCECDGPIWTTW